MKYFQTVAYCLVNLKFNRSFIVIPHWGWRDAPLSLHVADGSQIPTQCSSDCIKTYSLLPPSQPRDNQLTPHHTHIYMKRNQLLPLAEEYLPLGPIMALKLLLLVRLSSSASSGDLYGSPLWILLLGGVAPTKGVREQKERERDRVMNRFLIEKPLCLCTRPRRNKIGLLLFCALS